MKNYQVGGLCIIASICLIILTLTFEGEVIFQRRVSLLIGGLGLITGSLIIFFGRLIGIDNEKEGQNE